eukprot:TRINITY_DN21488_c0_g1_i1.p1 TRINITY_DN21488_c0_g1~~TRINITY_DN21488_c0_g1_i1.p1  ORF type:complete len:588 (+),score=95.15 TRINITY_DN21488_c0_g1_i1:73-1836(+)
MAASRAGRTAATVAFDGVAVQMRGSSLKHTFRPLWLRLNDPGARTKNLQRLFEISDVVNNPACSQVLKQSSTESGLEIDWADGQRSLFSWQWLASKVQPSSATQAHLWNQGLRHFVPEMQCDSLGSKEGKFRLAAYLERYGLVLVRAVPCIPGMVETVCNSVGQVRVTNYGSLFDVIDQGSEGNNLAFTNCRIGAHTDNPYRDPFPGIQVLHCLQDSPCEGGATLFTDGVAAAEILRKEEPEAFRILSSVAQPYEFKDEKSGVFLKTTTPVITLGDDGQQVVRIAFNNRSAAPLPPGSESVDAYYKAWALFDAICNSDDLQVPIRLTPGDMIIWSNARVMHGRQEYVSGGRTRHLQGLYLDHDEFHSKVAHAQESQEPTIAGCDVHSERTKRCLEALASQAEHCYGEGVDMLQHALQCAHVAAEAGEEENGILACLMHDVGNSAQARAAWQAAGNEAPDLLVSPSDNSIGYRHHAKIGEFFLRNLGFSDDVASAVGLHVSAKRALVAAEPSYMQELSQASIDTLAQQGGPLNAQELEEFRALPGSDVALRLRRYDDQGKAAGKAVPGLSDYKDMIYRHLLSRSKAFD